MTPKSATLTSTNTTANAKSRKGCGIADIEADKSTLIAERSTCAEEAEAAKSLKSER